MRIAHIAPPWISVPPRHYGGTENVIFTLVEEQIAQGHEVTLFSPADACTSARCISFFECSLFESGFPWQAHLKAYYHLHKAVNYLKQHQHDFDILHTHLSSSSDMYIFPLTERLSLPHVTTLHSQFPFDNINGVWQGDADYYYMEWLVDAPLVAISESARQQELQKFDLNFIDIVHHGLNFKDFAPPCDTPADFCLWLGRVSPEKGPHLAIQAAQQAGVPLILAGTIDPNVPEAQAYFQEQIMPELDGEQIRYVGPISRHKRNVLLHQARALLNPLLWEEPFGMVMLESLAAGCPVIAFQRGAAAEIVTDGQTGFLVDTVAEMVERLAQVHTLDRSSVRRIAEARFSAANMAENYMRVYKRVIAMRMECQEQKLAIHATGTDARAGL